MIIAVDWDGTVVTQDRPWDDLGPMAYLPGAIDGLRALRRAGHVLVLWSARSSLAARVDERHDPLVRAGLRRAGRGPRDYALAEARYQQMLDQVARDLPGVFAYICDGTEGGKPLGCDLFLDDRARTMGEPGSWAEVALDYGVAAKVGRARAFIDTFRGAWAAFGEVVEIGTTASGPILALASSWPGSRRLAILAGQHGEESAGVVALALHLPEIAEAAQAAGVGLVVYPLVNPEGFDADRRRNNAGAVGNTAMGYVVGGKLVGELAPGVKADGYVPWWSLPSLPAEECRAVVADLEVRAPIHLLADLHQDSIMRRAGEAFAYVQGARGRELGGACMAASGADPFVGALQNRGWSSVPLATDEFGLTELHDGSITDWIVTVRGAEASFVLETSFVDIDRAVDVNRRFLLALIERAL